MEEKILEYFEGFDGDKRKVLEKYRSVILGASEELKEKISWGMPSYYINKYIIHFAGHKNHVGLYGGETVVREFQDRLGNYEYSKGTIQVKYTDDIPEKLIRDIIDFNIKRDKEHKKK